MWRLPSCVNQEGVRDPGDGATSSGVQEQEGQHDIQSMSSTGAHLEERFPFQYNVSFSKKSILDYSLDVFRDCLICKMWCYMQAIFLYLYIYLYISIYLSTSLYISLSIYPSLYIYLYIYNFLYLQFIHMALSLISEESLTIRTLTWETTEPFTRSSWAWAGSAPDLGQHHSWVSTTPGSAPDLSQHLMDRAGTGCHANGREMSTPNRSHLVHRSHSASTIISSSVSRGRLTLTGWG